MNWRNSGSSWPSAEEDPVTAYALDVGRGTILAGKWQRLACERHLNDWVRAERGGGAFEFRAVLAKRAIGLFGLLRHFKGEWGGQPIRLEQFQQFIVGSLLGWVDRSTGMRRFRNAFIELPRGNGKSTLVAGLLLLLTFFDNEPGADGFCIATKKDQARIVFRTCRQMVLRSKAIKKLLIVQRHKIMAEDSESTLEPLGADADTLDGLRPAVAAADEVHKYASPDLIDVIESGMGTRRQPLLIEITTAGEEEESVYGYHRGISDQVLEGTVDLPEWFTFIASADAEDDWTTVEAQKKANPCYGVSVKPEFLDKELRKALVDPTQQGKYKRLYLGLRTGAIDGYFPMEAWKACTWTATDEELHAAPCWVGVDFSSRVDLTAVVFLWMLPGDRIVVRAKFWVPEANLEDRRHRDRFPYPQLKADKWLEVTTGNVVNQQTIRKYIVEQAAIWKPREIAYDRWNAQELMERYIQDEDGLTVVEVPQQPKFLSEATKRLKEYILEGRIDHGHHPILTWNFSNAKVREDSNGNVMLCKKKSRKRIDGASATDTALNRALSFKAEDTSSIYDTPDGGLGEGGMDAFRF